MLSLTVANDYELHACDIEQAFLQADKLPESVNGRYFIQPPPVAQTLITEMLCTRFAAIKMVQAGYAERVLRTFGMSCAHSYGPKCTFDEAGFARSRRPSSASTDEEHCGMSLISGQHDATRSGIYIFSTQQVRSITRSSTFSGC